MYLPVLAPFVMLISLFDITLDFLFIHLECTWMQYIENILPVLSDVHIGSYIRF